MVRVTGSVSHISNSLVDHRKLFPKLYRLAKAAKMILAGFHCIESLYQSSTHTIILHIIHRCEHVGCNQEIIDFCIKTIPRPRSDFRMSQSLASLRRPWENRRALRNLQGFTGSQELSSFCFAIKWDEGCLIHLMLTLLCVYIHIDVYIYSYSSLHTRD